MFLEVPERKPGCDYIVIERTNTGERDHIDTAVLAVQSISPSSMYNAAALSHRAAAAMRRMIELRNVSRAVLENEYNYTDTRTKEYRYQAVIDLVYMNEE